MERQVRAGHNIYKLADLLKKKIHPPTPKTKETDQNNPRGEPSLRLLMKIKKHTKTSNISQHVGESSAAHRSASKRAAKKDNLAPISGKSIGLIKQQPRSIFKRSVSPSIFTQFELQQKGQRFNTQHSSTTERLSMKRYTEGSFARTSQTDNFNKVSVQKLTTEEFFNGQQNDNYVNILEQIDNEEDDKQDAIEHHIQETLSCAELTLEWVKSNWVDLIPIFKEKFSNVSYLNHFEVILHLYHFVVIHIYELKSLDFESIMTSPKYKDPAKGRSFLDRPKTTNMSDLPLKKEKLKGFFITDLAKKNRGKIIWKDASEPHTTLSWNALKEEHLFFIGKGLLFMFRAAEDFMGGHGIDYSRHLINLEAVIQRAIKCDKAFVTNVCQAFSRLFPRIASNSFILEDEEFVLIASSYLATICQALENYIGHFAKGEKLIAGIAWEVFRMDETLEYLLRVQKKRSPLVAHAAHRLIRYFELLKELLIVTPRDHWLLLANVYSTMMAYADYSQTYALLRQRFGQEGQLTLIFQSVIIQMNTSTEELIARGVKLSGSDNEYSNLYFDVCTQAYTRLERHFQTSVFYERLTRIELDTFIVKELIMFIHCLTKFALEKRRKDNSQLMAMSLKVLSTIQHHITGEMFALNNQNLPFKYSSLKSHFYSLLLLIKRVSKADAEVLSQIGRILSSLIKALD